VKNTASLLSIYLHHTAVENAHPKLQHDAAEFLVGVRSSTRDEWKMMSMVIF